MGKIKIDEADWKKVCTQLKELTEFCQVYKTIVDGLLYLLKKKGILTTEFIDPTLAKQGGK